METSENIARERRRGLFVKLLSNNEHILPIYNGKIMKFSPWSFYTNEKYLINYITTNM